MQKKLLKLNCHLALLQSVFGVPRVEALAVAFAVAVGGALGDAFE